jgi:hypothetical protein
MSEKQIHISKPLSGIVQSPNGDIQYYTTTTQLKNKHNPYLHKSILQDEELGQDYREIELNGDRITILAEDITNALQIECNALVVRFMCLFDFIINIFFIINSYYILGFFVALISMSGYFSTITYNRQGLIGYLIYQYIQSISKLALTTLYIISFASHKYRFVIQLEKEYLIILNPTTQNIILLSLSSFAQIYITYFIQRFYNRLKKVSIQHN